MQRIFLLLGLSLIIACAPAERVEGDYVYRGDQVLYKGDLPNRVVIHLESEPPSLHPSNSRTAYKDDVLGYTHQKLTVQDISTGELTPQLARELPTISEDGLSYTYYLHPRAAWPDGKAITAADVAFTIKAATCPLTHNESQKPYLESLGNLLMNEADPTEITLVFKEPYMLNPWFGLILIILDPRIYDPEDLLGDWSYEQLAGLSDEAAEQESTLRIWAEYYNDGRWGTEVESLQGGSGPYRIESWEAEQQLVLSRNENYWGRDLEGRLHSQYPDQLIFLFLKDETSLKNMLLQQRIDVTTRLSTELYNSLKEEKAATDNYHVGIRPRASVALLGWNNKPDGINRKALFDDKRVRLAMNYAAPIEEIIKRYYEGTAERCTSPVSIVNSDYNSALKLIPLDLEKAGALLAEAGWGDSDGDLILDKMIEGEKVDFRFELIHPATDKKLDDIVQLYSAELKKIGIICEPKPNGIGNLVAALQSGDYDGCLIALSSPSLPYDFKQMWHSSNWPDGDNFWGFSNVEADRLIDLSRVETDPELRKVMVDRIQEILYDEQPCTFFFNPTKKIAIHRRYNHAEMYGIRSYVILNDLQMLLYDGAN